MEFNRRYNRSEFINFLQHHFLPEDFVTETTQIDMVRQTQYIRSITKLGSCETLDLVVYEVRHSSTHDARIGLSKEAFRFLADEWESKALVLFIPEGNDANYRFSLITIDLDETEEGKIHKVYSNPRRYSYFLGEGIACYTPNKYLNTLGRVTDDKDLTERFSVEVLTKAFYQELSDWYAWAVKVIRFPNKLDDETDDDKYNNISAIRLVTRLIFVWFLKQKKLIPDEFFDEKFIAYNLLEDFNPNLQSGLFGHKSLESKYYKAILQNLFFAMLNSPITSEGKDSVSERRFSKADSSDYGNFKLMRYEKYFKNSQLFVDLANHIVPFLNGGLFDCLDDKDNKIYLDGFSDNPKIQSLLVVPDFLFFGEEVGKNIDLSEWYGDKRKKRVSARGIIDILKRYNFTVEENTPFDQEVSLDPELLGKVFENLLASYNPETQTTARKQTGSFYTPRDIVQYMVDESLVAHLKRIVGEELEPEYRKLISYVDEDILLTADQKLQVMEAIYHCKVLDPACGSGAFPVGMLQQMVHILSQLDPTNEQWKKMMLDEAVDESRNAFQAESKEEREERLKDIEASFDESLNNPDYARKLYLIENCIYGVDIQPIAIQISKLRFFISLVVDQKTTNDPVKNFGIRPLPNLEAKFVAANSLIPLAKSECTLARTPEIITLENKLKEANHKIFSAKTIRTKRRWKDRLIELRSEMAEKLKDNGFLTIDAANQLASWNMFDQNSAASFFDADWMFGVKDGFDVVIGNPPYRIMTRNNTDNYLLTQYINLYLSIKNANSKNLYTLFIEKTITTLISNKGLVSFIVPEGLYKTRSYSDCVNLMNNYGSTIICVDFEEYVFESAITGNLIFIYQKGTYKPTSLYHFDKDMNLTNKVVNENKVLSKVEQGTLPLIQIASLFKGMVVKDRDDVLYSSSINNTHKFILGKNISKWKIKSTYYTNYDDLVIIGGTKRLSKHNISPRIVIRRTGDTLCCAMLEEPMLTESTLYSCWPINSFFDIRYIYGILNSKLIDYYNKTLNITNQQGFPQILMTDLQNLPIKNINEDEQSSIVRVVSKIIDANSNNICFEELEIKLDKLIYHLYDLTYDEIRIVDPETPITREEYESNN